MARPYLAEFPTVPCAICTTPTAMLGTKLCDPCWHTQQNLRTHVRKVLGNPKTAPAMRALLEEVLTEKPEPAKEEPA